MGGNIGPVYVTSVSSFQTFSYHVTVNPDRACRLKRVHGPLKSFTVALKRHSRYDRYMTETPKDRGRYNLYINGHYVLSAVPGPAWTDLVNYFRATDGEEAVAYTFTLSATSLETPNAE